MQLVNPYSEPQRVVPFQGTRLLQETFGLPGVQLYDPKDSGRLWGIQTVYSPVPGRALGGIRVKLIDMKGFITFCNQRDLEVLLGRGVPGRWCPWLGQVYVHPDEREWLGFCADDDDLLDDLQEREFMLRQQVQGGVLTPPLDFLRRVHLEPRNDFEELHILLGDYDPESGMYPDIRLETIERRWVRSHRERVRWDRI